MAYTYKEKFPGNRMTVYLANISQNRYSRDKWVLPLMDSVQFYVSVWGIFARKNIWKYFLFQQQCCGGNGPQDYFNSFWYITNTERGTRSFVPRSCCRQTQSGRAWSLHPIDPMCTTYGYYTKSFNDSVNIQVNLKIYILSIWSDSWVLFFVLTIFSTSIFSMSRGVAIRWRNGHTTKCTCS